MKLQLFEDGQIVKRDGKPVTVEVRDEIQLAAFLKHGFKEVEEKKDEK